MAIDTLDKRASAGQFGLWDFIAPTPDGAIDTTADRSQCNWLYRGVVPGLSPDCEGIEYHLSGERMHYSASGRLHYRAAGRPMHYKALEDDG